MKLFLASYATHPQSLEQIKESVGGSWQGKTIVYIPTAKNGEEFGSWKKSDSFIRLQKLGATIKPIELEQYVHKSISSEFKNADIVWFGGGQTGYLLYWIRRVSLDTYLPEVLEKGALYVGSSAGSMVCSKTQFASELYIGEPERGASLLPGLGYIDFEIYPHFTDDLKPELERLWKKGKLYLIKDGEAIVKDKDKVTVLGKERIIEK